MNRRTLLQGLSAIAASTLRAQAPPPLDKGLKITGVRLVQARPRHPLPPYTPAPTSYWVTREAARPIMVYPQHTGKRGPGSTWMPDPAGPIRGFTVEIETNKKLKGYGRGDAGGGPIIEGHLAKLLIGENPLDIERLWDVMWRATLFYGRAGAAIHAISGIDLALWDLAGKVWGAPVYRLLGGRTWDRVPAYVTGNDIEQSLAFGYTKLKLALPWGPAQGRDGLKKNVALVKRTRELAGPDCDIMIDCWMALNETYTIQFAEAIAPYNVHWIEEVLPPDDYEGFTRLNAQITSTLIATGEHEYTRWGFRRLLNAKAADIWQPEIMACGGMSEMRHIGSLALANDIPLYPHAGGSETAIHYLAYHPALTWAETTLPPPGGPDRVYKMFEEQRNVTRGPEGVYFQPSEAPGFGWDFDVS